MTTHPSTPAISPSINRTLDRSTALAARIAAGSRALVQSVVRRIRNSWRAGAAMDAEFDRRREDARQMFYAQSGGRY